MRGLGDLISHKSVKGSRQNNGPFTVRLTLGTVSREKNCCSFGFSPNYYRVLQSITGYYRLLQSIAEYYIVYRVLQMITEYYRVLQSMTKYYKVLQSFKKYYRDRNKPSASTWTNFWACLV